MTRIHRNQIRPVLSALLAIVVLAAHHGSAFAAPWPDAVERALVKAGKNRPQLEKVLEHYRTAGNAKKREAAEFLIANMEGHGYVVFGLYDAKKNEIPFDALNYHTFAEAQAAMDALEKKHGTVDFKKKTLTEDLEVITADQLTENIELAFRAWRQRLWARRLSWEAFRDYVLPYRGSEEPINPFRAHCMEQFAHLAEEMKDPADPQEAATKILHDVESWIRFAELYYLHPTDQSFNEMRQHKLGRCEDMTNMQLYALRANGIAVGSDYTPAWADRDNNHAWTVILDADGRGKAGLSNRAAKVYRKVYAIQRDSLAFRVKQPEQAPNWLRGKYSLDVTDQYLPTTDVTVRLEGRRPDGAAFAYLCVFNGGEWTAIHWAAIDGDHATFTKMGRNIAYLPAYYVNEKIAPAAAPFILTKDGKMFPLGGSVDGTLAIEMSATTPTTPDADTRRDKPMIVVKPGKTYELFAWKDGWVSHGKQQASDKPVSFDKAPAGRLYWLVEEGSRKLERIFTIESGKPVWW